MNVHFPKTENTSEIENFWGFCPLLDNVYKSSIASAAALAAQAAPQLLEKWESSVYDQTSQRWRQDSKLMIEITAETTPIIICRHEVLELLHT